MKVKMENSELRKQLNDMKRAADKSKSSENELLAKLKGLTTQKQQIKEENTELRKHVGDLTGELNGITELRKQLSDMKRAAEKSKSSENELLAKLKGLTIQKQQIKEENTELKKHVGDLTGELNGIRAADKSKSSKNELLAKLKGLAMQKQQIKEENTELRKHVGDLTGELNGIKRTVEKAKTTENELWAKLKELVLEKQQIEMKLNKQAEQSTSDMYQPAQPIETPKTAVAIAIERDFTFNLTQDNKTVTLEEKTRFDPPRLCTAICAMQGNYFATHERSPLQGDKSSSPPVHKMEVCDPSGNVVKRFRADCGKCRTGFVEFASMKIGGKPTVAKICTYCERINIFNFEEDFQSFQVRPIDGIDAVSICPGPNGSFVFLDQSRQKLKELQVDHEPVKLTTLVYLSAVSNPGQIAYDSSEDMFFIVGKAGKQLVAYGWKRYSGQYSECWAHENMINGNKIEITAICSNGNGRLYLVNGRGQIFVIASGTGIMLKSEVKQGAQMNNIHEISCSEGQGTASETLIVRHGRSISCLSVHVQGWGKPLVCQSLPDILAQH